MEAIKEIELSAPDLMLLDHRLGDMTGMDVLKQVKAKHPDLVVIMITAFGNISLAVEAMKNGAYDFIEKETDPELVGFVVRKALDTIRLKKEVDELQKEHLANRNLDNVFAESQAMKRTLELAKEFAKSDTTVLLEGETGTGKSLVAELVHVHSHRFNNRFVTINCGAIPKELIESELFSYEPGAFTGAHIKEKIGLIERANHGTLFLDEIGELTLDLQSKLLQVLERNDFLRVGSVEPVKVDVRFIAATNAKLVERIKQKQFRPDLYYRLNVASIHIPPLKERKADILPMAKYFVQKFNLKFISIPILIGKANENPTLAFWSQLSNPVLKHPNTPDECQANCRLVDPFCSLYLGRFLHIMPTAHRSNNHARKPLLHYFAHFPNTYRCGS